MRVSILFSILLFTISFARSQPQDAPSGQSVFENTCAKCHGGNGDGGEFGPSIILRLPSRSDAELAALIRGGFPNAGRPPLDLDNATMHPLVGYLRTLRPRRGVAAPSCGGRADGRRGRSEGACAQSDV